MLKKKNGYSMIEVLIASGIFFQALVILIPIYSQIEKAKLDLSDKRWAAMQLHDEMQQFLKGDPLLHPTSFTIENNKRRFNFRFQIKDTYTEGCVTWSNAKGFAEEICLLGISENGRRV